MRISILVGLLLIVLTVCGYTFATTPNVVRIEKKEVVINEDYLNGTDGYFLVGENQEGYGQNQLLKYNTYSPRQIGYGNEQPVSDELYVPTEIDKRTYGIFANSCASCHGTQKQSGKLQLIDGKDLLLQPLATRVDIVDRVSSKTDDLKSRGKKHMPMGGEEDLSQEDQDILRLWMVQEADQLRQRYKK